MSSDDNKPGWLVEPTEERERYEDPHRAAGLAWVVLFLLFIAACVTSGLLLWNMLAHNG